MVLLLLPKPSGTTTDRGDHHFTLPVVSPVPRPSIPGNSRVW